MADRIFKNPMPRLARIMIPFAAIPGCIAVLVALIMPTFEQDTFLFGLFAAVAGPIVMYSTDYALRPPVVVLNEAGVRLSYKSGKWLLIPWGEIETSTLPASMYTAGEKPGNIRRRGSSRIYYSVSETIFQEILTVLRQKATIMPASDFNH